jgi:hypothetical protein
MDPGALGPRMIIAVNCESSQITLLLRPPRGGHGVRGPVLTAGEIWVALDTGRGQWQAGD